MENMQCNDTVDNALAELVGLQNRNLNYTPGTTTISSSPSLSYARKFHPHFSCQGSGITSATANSQGEQMHPKFISKIRHSPRKPCEVPAFRMRPYLVPERSRTKSESLDLTCTLPELLSGSSATNSDDAPFNLQPMSTTSTTNSASYSMMSSTLMDDTSRSPGILMPQCSLFDYETAHEAHVAAVRGYSMEPRRMRLKMMQAMKKSKSLEDVRAEANLDGSQLSHEMEFVSSRIQKLKVQEQE